MPLKPITLESADRFTALVLGTAGKGKTSLLRTIPEEDRVCVLSAESGLLCVRDLVKSGRVEGWEITSFEDIREAFAILNKPESKELFKWVFIDSLTEIAGRCVEAMKVKHKSSSDTFKLWGEYSESLVKMIKGFRDMKPYNVVFTCLVESDKDANNIMYWSPLMPGKEIKKMLDSFFDEVFYLDIFQGEDGQPTRALITQPIQKYPAKDRSGALDLYERPDLSIIKKKILQEGNSNG